MDARDPGLAPPGDASVASAPSPRTSVVIPCRNEAPYIRSVLDAVLHAQPPPGGIEILVADGMSTDGTREVLAEYAARYPEVVRVIDNPAFVVPHGLNAAIREARGEFIVRLDAHTYCEPGYVAGCVEWLERSDADVVGGALVVEPSGEGWFARALARSVSHPFGVGNAHHKASDVRQPRYVDTVAFGAFRKLLFERVGYFREDLARSQDMEFNIRLRKLGGKILLVPEIRSHYQVRSELSRILPYYFSNGFWVLFPLRYGVRAFAFRHLVPFFLVAWLALFGVLAPFAPWAGVLCALGAGSYALAAVVAAVHIAVTQRRAEYLCTMPFAFALLHLTHGVGTAYGGACVLAEKLLPDGVFRKATPTARV